jgi:hypothetical protein
MIVAALLAMVLALFQRLRVDMVVENDVARGQCILPNERKQSEQGKKKCV